MLSSLYNDEFIFGETKQSDGFVRKKPQTFVEKKRYGLPHETC